MAKMITLQKWAADYFDPVPKPSALFRFARTNQISPPAKKVGRTWYVEQNAEFVGLQDIAIPEDDELLTRIFANG